MQQPHFPVDSSRKALRTVVERSRLAHRFVRRVATEFNRALDADVYGASYFGSGRNPHGREGISGYERYDRETSNANVSSYIAWKYINASRSLDVGCAAGYVVEALRELGVDAWGTDISTYATSQAAPGAQGRLRYGNLMERLPANTGEYDLVTVFETLEHLPPEAIPTALAELRRVCGGYLVATIPSFGPNPNGRKAWFEGKVRPGAESKYYGLGDDYRGPIPTKDLNVDANGNLLEGHLTIAAYAWWADLFADAGFIRCDALERKMNYDLLRFDMLEYWDLYAFRIPEASEPIGPVRTEAELAEIEDSFGLEKRAVQALAEQRGLALAEFWKLQPKNDSL